MREYFVDAWFMIAVLDRSDAHHPQAVRLGDRIKRLPAALVTHEAVFTEVLAYFCDDGAQARERAVNMVRRSQALWTVVSIDRDLFDAALDLYAARPDKEYSLTDCMSMVVMREQRIEHVLTNDHHFRQEGFTVLSE
jgi:predicted nucleic acid-binding protein